MPNIKSAKKRVKVISTKTLQNKMFKSQLKTTVKKFRAAVESGDLARGFEIAHALKGVTGNLALTPIDKPVREITELLRSRTEMDYSGLLGEIIAKKNELTELLR